MIPPMVSAYGTRVNFKSGTFAGRSFQSGHVKVGLPRLTGPVFALLFWGGVASLRNDRQIGMYGAWENAPHWKERQL